MDGPGLVANSGGFSVGSAVVDLSLDDTAARQKLDSFRADLQSIVSGNFSVPSGTNVPTGTVTPMPGPGSVSAGQGAFAVGGGAFGAQRLEVDTTQAQAAIQALKTQVSELAVAMESIGRVGGVGRRIPTGTNLSELFGVDLGGHVPLGASTGRNGHVQPYEINDFTGTGAFALRPLQPHQIPHSAPVFAPAISEAEDEWLAFQQASAGGGESGMGGRSRRGGGGGGFSPYMNPFSTRGLARLAGNGLAVYGGMMAIRAIGGLTDAATEGPLLYQQQMRSHDQMGSMTDPHNVASRSIGERVQLQREGDAWSALGIVGDIFDVGRMERQERMALLDHRAALSVALPQIAMDADIAQARAAGNPVRAAQLSAQKSRMTAGEDLRRISATFNNDSGSPEVLAGRDILRRTATAGEYDVAKAEGNVAAMSYDVASRDVLLTHDRGSEVRSLQYEGEALKIRQDSQLEIANRSLLKARDKLSHTQSRGADGKNYDVYTGSKENMDAFNEARSDREAIKRQQKLERDHQSAMEYDQAFHAELTADNAVARVRSVNARAGNDAFGASMIEFEAQAEAARKAASAQGVDLKPAITAERVIRNQRHAFDLQVAGEGYDARISAAHEQMALRPMTASAGMEVASARREVAGASPEERARVIAAQTAELKAHQFLLTAQRGGLTAVDMSAHEAMGLMSSRGVDLTGRQIDIQHARQTYGQGVKDLANAPEAPHASDTVLQGLVGQILAWLKSQKSSSGGQWPTR